MIYVRKYFWRDGFIYIIELGGRYYALWMDNEECIHHKSPPCPTELDAVAYMRRREEIDEQ